LAKAYFEADMYKECQATLVRLIHLNPMDMTVWYNLALSKEFTARTILKSENVSPKQVHQATEDLNEAIKLFEYLQKTAETDAKKKV